jgi:protein-disulfide isomerase
LKKIYTLLFSSLLVLGACTRLTKEQILEAIKEDPSLLASAIKKDPAAFREAFQAAQEQLRAQYAKEQQDQAQKDQEKYLLNPIDPKLTPAQVFKGAENAPITIVEYTDFECPYCSRGAESMEAVLKQFDGKVKVTVRHLPLPFHKKAMPAAQYFEALRIQNPKAAIAFHDATFANQEELKQKGPSFFDARAKKMGINLAKLKTDQASSTVAQKIEADMAQARELGFRGTPSFLVGGIPLRGALPPEEFAKVIDLILKKKG